MFARAMLGEGVAIDPTDDDAARALRWGGDPAAAARHAVTLRADGGAELLLHVGIDTVALNGAGFAATCGGRQGMRRRWLLSFDLDALASRARSLITP